MYPFQESKQESVLLFHWREKRKRGEAMQVLCLQPRGFGTGAKNIGIKDKTLDFTVIASEVPASAAALFTQNRFSGAAIAVGREHVSNGQLQAFVITSKNDIVS